MSYISELIQHPLFNEESYYPSNDRNFKYQVTFHLIIKNENQKDHPLKDLYMTSNVKVSVLTNTT